MPSCSGRLCSAISEKMNTAPPIVIEMTKIANQPEVVLVTARPQGLYCT